MSRNTAYRSDWVEVLENRRLLSASPGGLVLGVSTTLLAAEVQPQVTTPSIVGTFTGTLTQNNVKGTGSLTVVFITQTSRGTVSGTGSNKWPGKHTSEWTFNGKIHGDSVTMTVTNDGTVITGTVSKNGSVIIGTHKNSKDGSTGTFSVTRAKSRR